MSPLSRRHFLGLAGGAAAATALGCAPGGLTADRSDTAVPEGSVAGAIPPGRSAGRTLVIVQLAGGLDGLTALVPGDGRYRDARPTLAVPEGDLVALTGTTAFGLHPALGALAAQYGSGRLAAVVGLGMEGQSRSHFQALDTMWSARPGEARLSGWGGRWLDAVDGDDVPLRAVALGSPGPALVGESAAPTVVLDPEAFELAAPAGSDQAALTSALLGLADPPAQDGWVAAAQQSWLSTVDSVEALRNADPTGGTSRPERGRGARAGLGGGTAVELLDVAAGIIELDAGTRIVQVGLSGFDTHANQAEALPTLLEDLASGLGAFDERIGDGGRSGDVLVLVQSEFGRRVVENGGGTDHGRAGLALLLGDAVDGGRIAGEVRLGELVDGDVPIVVDTRSIYADVLDWLGGPTEEVLGFDERLGVVTA